LKVVVVVVVVSMVVEEEEEEEEEEEKCRRLTVFSSLSAIALVDNFMTSTFLLAII